MNTINLRCKTTKKNTRSRKKRDKVTYGKILDISKSYRHWQWYRSTRNSELIWPDKKGKGGLTIPLWERKATWHGVCKRIITKYRYILIGSHLNQETHVSNYTMHSNSCMIFLKLQPNAIVQANCEQDIVRSQITDSVPWNLYNRTLPLNYLLYATIWL